MRPPAADVGEAFLREEKHVGHEITPLDSHTFMARGKTVWVLLYDASHNVETSADSGIWIEEVRYAVYVDGRNSGGGIIE